MARYYENPQTGEVYDRETKRILSAREFKYQQTNANLPPEYSPGAGDRPFTGTPGSQSANAALINAGQRMVGFGENINRLTGDRLGSIGSGIEQLMGQQVTPSTEGAGLLAPLQQEYPTASTVGQMLPGMSTLPLSGGLLGQTAIGAAQGAIESPDAKAGALQGMAYSAAGKVGGDLFGLLLGKGENVARNLIQNRGRALSGDVTKETERLLKRANDLGMTPSPGMVNDSKALRIAEASAKRNPLTANIPEKIVQQNIDAIDREAVKAIGETGELSGDTFARAADRIDRVYRKAAREAATVDVSGLQGFENRAGISKDTADYIESYKKRFPGLETGSLTGKDWDSLRQSVQKDIRNAWRNLPASAEDLQIFGGDLTKAIEKTLPGYRDELRKAGREWKYLKVLENPNAVSKQSGHVNPRTVASGLARVDKGGFTRNRNKSDFYDAIRLGNRFADVISDSGTPGGQFFNALFADPVTTLGGGLAMRGVLKNYYKQGGSPVIQGLVEQASAGQLPGQTGAALLRSYGLMGNQ